MTFDSYIKMKNQLLEKECKNIYYSQKQILKGCDVDTNIIDPCNQTLQNTLFNN
jgi:hypothetical protein